MHEPPADAASERHKLAARDRNAVVCEWFEDQSDKLQLWGANQSERGLQRHRWQKGGQRFYPRFNMCWSHHTCEERNEVLAARQPAATGADRVAHTQNGPVKLIVKLLMRHRGGKSRPAFGQQCRSCRRKRKRVESSSGAEAGEDCPASF